LVVEVVPSPQLKLYQTLSPSGSVVAAWYWYWVKITPLAVPEGAEGFAGALFDESAISTVISDDQAELAPFESVALT
jgi:hypothetical protein